MSRVATLVSVLLALVLPACAPGPGVDMDRERPAMCGAAKCDDASTPSTPRVTVDLDALNRQFPGPRMESIEDAFRVRVTVGGREIVADTHLFGGPVNVIPYEDGDAATDATGAAVGRGDAILASYVPPGDVVIVLKHHRPSHRVLSLDEADPTEMKEHFKLQDTHIGIAVGVERGGLPGVITLNNPQTYQSGRFGDASYPMVFLRPVYPDYLSDEQELQFRDNIRTMLLGFNAVSNFPGDYNGGDPLGARNPEEVRIHAEQMVRAIAGDPAARAWFQEPAHQIYCAELAHVSFSAGLHYPLNAATFVPLVGEETWNEFVRQLDEHAAGRPSAFTSLNRNPLAALVEVTLADEGLRGVSSYAPADSDDANRLAFSPMTMADIVESFMATHLPRSVLGEALAPVQGAVLQQMLPGLLEAMGMDALPSTDPRRMAVDTLFAQIVEVVSRPHESYAAFRTEVAPLLAQARAITGPRDGSGTGLFVPPSLMHLVAQGRRSGGLVGLRYVGHGVHWSLLRAPGSMGPGVDPMEPPPPVDPPAPPPDPASPAPMVLLEQSAMLDEDGEARFEVRVPEGYGRLVVTMEASGGDPDLYVRRGTAPTSTQYDCRPFLGAGEAETCDVAPPGIDTFHVRVHGYSASSFTLRARVE